MQRLILKSMDEATRITETLTPDERRARLRAYADRMLRMLGACDDPEDGAGVLRGMRAALMIERLYARCDAAEGAGLRQATQAMGDRVALEAKKRWAARLLERPLVLPNGEAVCPPVSLAAELSGSGAVAEFRPLPASLLMSLTRQAPPVNEAADAPAVISRLRARLRARIEAWTPGLTPKGPPDETPQDLVWYRRDYGLIGAEAVEALCGADIFGRLRLQGYHREDVLHTFGALSPDDIRLLWPGLFTPDTS